MFQDEAEFGRINKPKYCWWEKGIRPSVPFHHIREYRYAYGAVEPVTGSSCFLVMPYCNSTCMNIFLEELSKQYPDDLILLCCEGAAWHKSNKLHIPENIELFYIPPYTPEMNPIEQIWKELRITGFRNEVFATLEKVVSFGLLGRPEGNLRAAEGEGYFCTVFSYWKRRKEYDHEKRGGSI